MATPAPCIHYATGDLAVEAANALLVSPYPLSREVWSELNRLGRVLRLSDTTWPVVAVMEGVEESREVFLALDSTGGYVIWLPGYERYLIIGECGLDLYTGCAPHAWVQAFNNIGMDITTMPMHRAAYVLRVLFGNIS